MWGGVEEAPNENRFQIIKYGNKVKKMADIEKMASEIKKHPLMVEYLKEARRGYVCPACGNGSGEDGTGAIVSEDGTKLLCGKCQRGLTNIDVLATYLGIGTTGTDYVEVVKYGAEKLGISIPIQPIQPQKGKNKEELEKILREDIEQAREKLKSLSAKEKRGLTDETLEEFQIGVDFEWKPPKKRKGNAEKGTP